MENGKGRFPGWHEEAGGHETDGRKPDGPKPADTEKKKKKSKKSSDSSHAAAPAHTPENQRKSPEKDKVSKALAEFFVMRDEGDAAKSELGSKKKREEVSIPKAEEAEAETAATEPTTEHRPEWAREEVERAHNRPEADDDDPEDPEGESDEKPERTLERSHEKTSSAKYPEFELPLSSHDDKEILLPLDSEGEPVVEIVHGAEAEPEPEVVAEAVPEPVTEFARETAEEPEEAPRVSVSVPPLNYQRQPEVQHQAHAYAAPEHMEAAAFAAPEAAHPVAAEATPEVIPPVNPAEAAEEEPMVPVTEARRMEPAEAYRLYAEREAAQHNLYSSPGGEVVSKQAAEDAEYYAARAGQSRGFVTGLFVAGLWGHFKHKKMKREFNQAITKQGKQMRKTQEGQKYYAEEQSKRQGESERTLSATRRRLSDVEHQLRDRVTSHMPHPERVAKQVLHPGRAERQPQSAMRTEAQRQQRPDQEVLDQLAVPAEHHLETSAWHTIEVDTRTGKAVEQPTFAYGHEYYQERAHEAPPVPVAQRNAAAGEVVLTALQSESAQAQSGSTNTNVSGVSPMAPVDIPSATRQGPPAPREQPKDSSVRNPLSAISSSGPIWPYVLTLAVIFICLLFLL